jgi:hypothetical protein
MLRVCETHSNTAPIAIPPLASNTPYKLSRPTWQRMLPVCLLLVLKPAERKLPLEKMLKLLSTTFITTVGIVQKQRT